MRRVVPGLLEASAMPPKHTVYILHSLSEPKRPYIGLTSDVAARLADHNAGRCPHTARHRPWQIHVIIELADEQRAVAFEHYLKSGSGRAFAKAALWIGLAVSVRPTEGPGGGACLLFDRRDKIAHLKDRQGGDDADISVLLGNAGVRGYRPSAAGDGAGSRARDRVHSQGGRHPGPALSRDDRHQEHQPAVTRPLAAGLVPRLVRHRELREEHLSLSSVRTGRPRAAACTGAEADLANRHEGDLARHRRV